jgi:hypothetical protein
VYNIVCVVLVRRTCLTIRHGTCRARAKKLGCVRLPGPSRPCMDKCAVRAHRQVGRGGTRDTHHRRAQQQQRLAASMRADEAGRPAAGAGPRPLPAGASRVVCEARREDRRRRRRRERWGNPGSNPHDPPLFLQPPPETSKITAPPRPPPPRAPCSSSLVIILRPPPVASCLPACPAPPLLLNPMRQAPPGILVPFYSRLAVRPRGLAGGRAASRSSRTKLPPAPRGRRARAEPPRLAAPRDRHRAGAARCRSPLPAPTGVQIHPGSDSFPLILVRSASSPLAWLVDDWIVPSSFCFVLFWSGLTTTLSLSLSLLVNCESATVRNQIQIFLPVG